MEHTGFYFDCDEPAKSSSDSNFQQPNDSSANNGVPIPIVPNNQGRHLPSTKPNKNYDIPITPVTKIALQFLPFNTTIKGDAKVIFSQFVSKYINFITAKASERCKIECRKTLQAEDLLSAMENLGFDDYVGPLGVYIDRYRHAEGKLSLHRGVSIPINAGQAIEPILKSGPNPNLGPIDRPRPVIGPGPVPNTGPIYKLGPMPSYGVIYEPEPGPICGLAPRLRPMLALEPSTVGMLQSTIPPPSLPSSTLGFSIDSNANSDTVDATMGINEFPRDGSSAGSSGNDIANFDPSIFLNFNLDNL